MELTRRDFLKYLGFIGATLAGVSFAECEQPKETGATQVKKPESKPSYSSSMDERIIEETRRRGKEINDVFLEMKNTFSEEGGKWYIEDYGTWSSYHFIRADQPFEMFIYRAKGDINKRVEAFIGFLNWFILPGISVVYTYDHFVAKGSYSEDEGYPSEKAIRRFVEKWDEIFLDYMKSAIEGKKPSEIFLIVDPRVAKKKWKYEIEKYCGKRYPKTTEIWMGEEYRGILDEYGAGWIEEIREQEDEIKEGIEKTCKYLAKKAPDTNADYVADFWRDIGLRTAAKLGGM